MGETSRRAFITQAALGIGLGGFALKAAAEEKPIQGFEDTGSAPQTNKVWTPISDRKIKVGIVGYGVCRFGAAFGFQDHPNVEVVAVSDLDPARCAELAKACRCDKTYPSLEELIKDDSIEAVFVATDAPSHAQHCIDTLAHGKHVACAVPATFGSLEDADRLYEAVKKSGLNYMMYETTVYRDDCYAMREIYNSGHMGRLVYAEGEYYHYMDVPIDSYKGWRIGLPPQLYPTHSNGYYTGVTGGSFTEVSCMGIPSVIDHLKPENNRYKNPFGTEIALFRTNDGGMARMAVSWDTPGFHGEIGRVRGDHGSVWNTEFQGTPESNANVAKLDLTKPPLPPKVEGGGHGGSHGHLTEEFINSILQERKPLIDIAWSLNMTVAGIVAHESAMKDGELLKIPHYTF